MRQSQFLQRSCSWHRLTSVICDQQKKKEKKKGNKKTQKFLLKRKCQKVLPEQKKKITRLIILFFFFSPKRTSDSLVVEVHQNLRAEVAGGISWRDRDSHTRTMGLPQPLTAQEEKETRSVLTKTIPVLPSSCTASVQGPGEAFWKVVNSGLLVSVGRGCACGQGQGCTRPCSVFPAS